MEPEKNDKHEAGKTGDWGEGIAARFFSRRLQYRILTRNWTWKRGELDLICYGDSMIVFVEVRTRVWTPDADPIDPYASISYRKKRLLHKTAIAWLRQNRCLQESWRFDVLGIQYRNRKDFRVQHWMDVRF